MEKYSSLKQELTSEHKNLLQNKKHYKDVKNVSDFINSISGSYYFDELDKRNTKNFLSNIENELLLELAKIFIHQYRVNRVKDDKNIKNNLNWYEVGATNFLLNDNEIKLGIDTLWLYKNIKNSKKNSIYGVMGLESLILIGDVINKKGLSKKIEQKEKEVLLNNKEILEQLNTNQRKLLKLLKLYNFNNEEIKQAVYSLYFNSKKVYQNREHTKISEEEDNYRDESLWGASIEIMTRAINNTWQSYKIIKDKEILVFLNKEINELEENLKIKENQKNRYSNTRLLEKIKQTIETSKEEEKNLLDFIKNQPNELNILYEGNEGKKFTFSLKIGDLVNYQRVKYKSISARKIVVSSVKKLMKDLGKNSLLSSIKIDKEKGNLDILKIVYTNKNNIEKELLLKILKKVLKYVLEEPIFKNVNSDNVNSIIEKIYMEEALIGKEKKEVKKAKIVKF